MARKYNDVIPGALMLIGGGIVGAGLGLLLAPRAGKETRKDIARFGQTVVNKGDKVVHELAGNVADFADTVGKKTATFVRSGWK